MGTTLLSYTEGRMSWSSEFYSLSTPSFVILGVQVVVDISVGDGYSTVSCSLHFNPL